MNKKNYFKPAMKVFELRHRPRLLYASEPGSYIPNMGNGEMNKLA